MKTIFKLKNVFLTSVLTLVTVAPGMSLPAYADTSTGASSVNGKVKVAPTASDSLPIALDTSSLPAKLNIQFKSVSSTETGSFTVDYAPQKNQNEFSFVSDGIDWVYVTDSTHADLGGHGNLTTYVNGVESVSQGVYITFNLTLGSSGLLGGTPDHVAMAIYNSGGELICPYDSADYTLDDDAVSSPILNLLGQGLQFQGIGGTTNNIANTGYVPGAYSMCEAPNQGTAD